MDHYEVRTWEAWHRFITLCLLAHALLVVMQAQALADQTHDGKKGVANRAWSRSPFRKRAAWCSRWASPMRNVDSDLAGRAGAGRTRRLLPAATLRAMPVRGAKGRTAMYVSRLPWHEVRSPMPSGNVSDRCCHRRSHRRDDRGTIIVPS